QSGSDAGAYSGPDPRRTLCQHRPRLQLRHRHPDGSEAGGLCHHGSGLRRGSGGGEVSGHQVPHGGAEAR
ncbi:DNA binding domain, excisionase family, partial [Dysosmobacter welbionis]